MTHEDQDSYEKIVTEMREWQAAPWDESPPLTIWADRIEALNRAQGWRPIETWDENPQESVLLAGPGWVAEGWWDAHEQGWWGANTHSTDQYDGRLWPTHWMPLPAAPNKEEGQ